MFSFPPPKTKLRYVLHLLSSYLRLRLLFTAICLFVLLAANTALSQRTNHTQDSLEQLLQHPLADSQRAACLAALGDFFNGNPQKAIGYYLKAYRINYQPAEKQNVGKAVVASKLCQMYRLNSYSASSAMWLDSMLRLAQSIKNIGVLTKLYVVADTYYAMFERYEDAISLNEKMLGMFAQLGVPGKSGTAYAGLAVMYFKMEQDDKALEYYRKALLYAGNKKLPGYDKAESDGVEKRVYIEICQVFGELNKYDSAYYYSNLAYTACVALGDVDGQCTALETKSNALQYLGRYNESLPPARAAVKIAFGDSIAYQQYAALCLLATGFAHMGQKDSALLYARMCDSNARRNIVNKEDWVGVYDMWVNMYKAIGDYKEAIDYEEKEMDAYKEYRDNEVNKAINRAEIQFDTKRKEEQIQNLDELTKKQRLVQWAIGAGLLLAAAAAVGFWLSYRNKNKAAAILEQSNKEKEVFLKEIHHRVKNNLQIISSLLYLQFKDYKDEKMLNALQQAQQRIKSMALVHNKLYEKQDVVHVYLKEYINDLAAGILASNNPEGKSIQISVNEKGNTAFSLDTSISIGLILNELITNSCKYAFAGKNEGNISIKVEQKEGRRYQLHVADDGNGLPADFEKKNSLGVRLVKNLARQMGGEASFATAGGTAVTILFTETIAA